MHILKLSNFILKRHEHLHFCVCSSHTHNIFPFQWWWWWWFLCCSSLFDDANKVSTCHLISSLLLISFASGGKGDLLEWLLILSRESRSSDGCKSLIFFYRMDICRTFVLSCCRSVVLLICQLWCNIGKRLSDCILASYEL